MLLIIGGNRRERKLVTLGHGGSIVCGPGLDGLSGRQQNWRSSGVTLVCSRAREQGVSYGLSVLSRPCEVGEVGWMTVCPSSVISVYSSIAMCIGVTPASHG